MMIGNQFDIIPPSPYNVFRTTLKTFCQEAN